MRALVVYESMYGNTHVVAGNIADGLRATYEVTLVPVAEVTAELVAGTDLLVAGARPTCTGGTGLLRVRSGARIRAHPAAGARGREAAAGDTGPADHHVQPASGRALRRRLWSWQPNQS